MRRPSWLGLGALLACTLGAVRLIDDALTDKSPCIEIPPQAVQHSDGTWQAGAIIYGWSVPGTDVCIQSWPPKP